MVMNFDNYSTSFQSLMGPMYNVQANYSAMTGGYGNGYGAGFGMGGYYPGMGAGYMGMGMGGFMTPMNGVGIGQFNADYLIKNDDKNNNYYARPVAVHKKHDEVPTMLGILGTALGTAALLLALAKGKKFKWPSRGARPQTNNPVNPNPAPGSQSSNIAGYLPAPTHKPVNPVNTNPVNPTNPGQGVQTTHIAGYLPAPTHKPVNPVNSNPVNPTNSGQGAQTTHIAGYLPAQTARQAQAIEKQKAAMNLPSSNQSWVVPSNTAPVAGYLPAQTAKQTQAIEKQQAAMNLSSSNQVLTTPVTNPETATKLGAMTPEAEAAYNRILGQQFRPGIAKQNRRIDAQIAFAGLKNNTPTQMVNQNLAEIRPDIAKQGNVVYTTHTPQTLSEGYSIGSNAKGSEKLQALLAQMNS